MKKTQFAIILLLGSYDPHTKEIMYRLKEKIAEVFSGTNTYAYLLDEISIFDEETTCQFLDTIFLWGGLSGMRLWTVARKPLGNIKTYFVEGKAQIRVGSQKLTCIKKH